MPRPDVSAVVVSWNTADLLDACLRSLHEHTDGYDVEVIVVDNGSTDGSAALVTRHWPDVTLVANEHNVGYQRANNQALPLIRGRHTLLINADAQLTPGALGQLVERLDDDPVAAVVGPRLVYGDGSWQRWTAGRAPDLRSAAAHFLLLDRLSPRTRSVWLTRDVAEPFRPDWVSSACMLVRTAVLDHIGGMDERYFCYMDDVDLCQRVRDAGFEVWYEPGADVVHLMNQATRRQTGAASPAALRNFNDYFRQRHGAVPAAVLRVMEVIGFLARAAAYVALGVVAARRDPLAQARAHVRHARISLQRGFV